MGHRRLDRPDGAAIGRREARPPAANAHRTGGRRICFQRSRPLPAVLPIPDPADTTRYLLDVGRGDAHAAERLMPAVSDELRAIAASFLRRERDNHTLQPTALVNEAYLRLIDSTVVADADRDRFLGFAARAMRQVLVDHARKVRAQKRGGDRWRRITLHPELASDGGGEMDLIELNDVLEKFERIDARACRVVEMHFFAGMGFAEVAGVLGVTERTALKDWSMARAWLGRELRSGQDT